MQYALPVYEAFMELCAKTPLQLPVFFALDSNNFFAGVAYKAFLDFDFTFLFILCVFSLKYFLLAYFHTKQKQLIITVLV